MKTATVTWITYNNYGTLLQAYALQKKIQQLGYENVILSDKIILEEYKANRTKAKKSSSTAPVDGWKEKQFSRLIGLAAHPPRLYRSVLARMAPARFEYPYEQSQKLCELFKASQLRILYDVDTPGLSKLNEKFDAFIAGSDQIWSVFDSIFNPYYYLSFVTKSKIAYAPSLGTDRIPEHTVQTLKELLSDFSAVSVREKVSALQLSELSGREVEWVADPTLLHDQRFWSDFASDTHLKKNKYMLCYFLENKKWYFDYARKLAKKLHLRMVLLPNRWDFLNHESVMTEGVGPKEFVSLIQHAKYVLTDSYHASIFALIFEKNFQYLLRFSKNDPNSQNIRVQSLFERLALHDRVVPEERSVLPEIHMEYDPIKKKIAEFRTESLRYLEDNLHLCEKGRKNHDR